MNMNSQNIDVLGQLLGCYFHQDWPDEFKNADQAIQAIVEGEPREQLIVGAKAIEELLEVKRSDADWRTIMTDKIGCYFDPESEGLTYAAWLRKVREAFLT